MPWRSGASFCRQNGKGSMLKSLRYQSMPNSPIRCTSRSVSQRRAAGSLSLKSPPLAAAEDELRVLAGDLRAGGNPLRLEPDDELQPQAVAGVAHRLQPVGKLLRLAGPVAHAVGEIAGEPGGVEPEEVAAGLGGDLGGLALPGLGGPRGMAVIAIVALPEDGHGQRTRLLLGRVVKEHQAAKAVVRRQPVALPGHEQDSRAANRLARVQAADGSAPCRRGAGSARPRRAGRTRPTGRSSRSR